MVELSIIVPVYNVEQYLDQCIKSILSQYYKNFELILVNDGSKDRSLEICQKYAAEYDNVFAFDQPNKGQMGARKAGVDHARGQYVGFVDSDDWIDKYMFLDMMNSAVETGCDVIISNGQRFLRKKTVPFCNRVKPGFYDEEQIKTDLFSHLLDNKDLYGNRGIQPSECLKVFKRDIIKTVYTMVPTEVRFGEDMACSYAALSLAKSAVVLDNSHVGYNYRLNTTSASWSYKEDVFNRSMTLCSFLRNLPGVADNKEYQLDVCYEECFFTVNAFFNEYLIDNQKHGQIKVERLSKIVNNEQFQNAYSKIDINTVKTPNKFLLKLLASKKVGWIRFVGGFLAIFRHQIIYVSQNWS